MHPSRTGTASVEATRGERLWRLAEVLPMIVARVEAEVPAPPNASNEQQAFLFAAESGRESLLQVPALCG
jgi:hypothetical protein